jgi:hypothetical protein
MVKVAEQHNIQNIFSLIPLPVNSIAHGNAAGIWYHNIDYAL